MRLALLLSLFILSARALEIEAFKCSKGVQSLRAQLPIDQRWRISFWVRWPEGFEGSFLTLGSFSFKPSFAKLGGLTSGPAVPNIEKTSHRFVFIKGGSKGPLEVCLDCRCRSEEAYEPFEVNFGGQPDLFCETDISFSQIRISKSQNSSRSSQDSKVEDKECGRASIGKPKVLFFNMPKSTMSGNLSNELENTGPMILLTSERIKYDALYKSSEKTSKAIKGTWLASGSDGFVFPAELKELWSDNRSFVLRMGLRVCIDSAENQGEAEETFLLFSRRNKGDLGEKLIELEASIGKRLTMILRLQKNVEQRVSIPLPSIESSFCTAPFIFKLVVQSPSLAGKGKVTLFSWSQKVSADFEGGLGKDDRIWLGGGKNLGTDSLMRGKGSIELRSVGLARGTYWPLNNFKKAKKPQNNHRTRRCKASMIRNPATNRCLRASQSFDLIETKTRGLKMLPLDLKVETGFVVAEVSFYFSPNSLESGLVFAGLGASKSEVSFQAIARAKRSEKSVLVLAWKAEKGRNPPSAVFAGFRGAGFGQVGLRLAIDPSTEETRKKKKNEDKENSLETREKCGPKEVELEGICLPCLGCKRCVGHPNICEEESLKEGSRSWLRLKLRKLFSKFFG